MFIKGPMSRVQTNPRIDTAYCQMSVWASPQLDGWVAFFKPALEGYPA